MPVGEMMLPSAALGRVFTQPVFGDEVVAPITKRETNLRRGFRIGGLGLFTEPLLLLEMLESPPIFPLPNAPATCLGLINLRSTLVPVFDIRELVGNSGGRARWILILGRGDEAAGLVIDDLPVQLNVADAKRIERLPAMQGMIAAHVKPGFHIGGEFFFELDHRSLLKAISGH